MVDTPSGDGDDSLAGTIHREDSSPRRGLSRRAFITLGVGLLGAGVGASGGVLVTRRKDGPFTSTTYDLGPVAAVVDQIRTEGVLPLPLGDYGVDEDSGLRRSPVDVVIWDPSSRYPEGTALDVYGPEGEDHPVINDHAGLMALVTIAPGGCLAPKCSTSGLYEDPCHFGRWNAWGESLLEPHDGFARLPLTIENGRVIAHLRTLTGPIPGRLYGSPVFDSEPDGPYCIHY